MLKPTCLALFALLALAPAARADLLGPPTSFPVTGSPSAFAVGDFNADGDPDLATATVPDGGGPGSTVISIRTAASIRAAAT